MFNIKNLSLQLYALILLLAFSCLGKAQQISPKELTIEMGIYEGGFNKYPQYMHQNYCQQPPNFKKEQIDRILGEVFIFCEALATEGILLHIKFVPIPNDARGMKMLEKGTLDTLSSSLWPFQYAHADIQVTRPSIRKGEFEKGIYVSASNHQLLAKNADTIDIKSLTGLTVSYWKHDVEVMKELTPNVVLIEYNPAVFKLLHAKRADFVLLEFAGNTTFEICQNEYCIYPLQGLKVAIQDSRHFVTSKTSKQGVALYKALNSGLKKLRQQGRIRKIYEDMGFLNAKVKDWKVLNPK